MYFLHRKCVLDFLFTIVHVNTVSKCHGIANYHMSSAYCANKWYNARFAYMLGACCSCDAKNTKAFTGGIAWHSLRMVNKKAETHSLVLHESFSAFFIMIIIINLDHIILKHLSISNRIRQIVCIAYISIDVNEKLFLFFWCRVGIHHPGLKWKIVNNEYDSTSTFKIKKKWICILEIDSLLW